jgi:hypothetical protein
VVALDGDVVIDNGQYDLGEYERLKDAVNEMSSKADRLARLPESASPRVCL